MATKDAPTSLQELKELLKDDIKVKVAGVDVDGILRGKYLSKDKFLSAVSADGFGFCSVIFGWDIHDAFYTKELSIGNRANGYRDVIAIIDLSTYRRIPWEDNVPFFLLSFLDPDTKKPLDVDPRGVLKTVIEQAATTDIECLAGVEYEYYNFKETPQTLAEKGFHDLRPLTTGMHCYSLLRTQLNEEYFKGIFDESWKFDIPIEGHHTEAGPGIFETALAYTSALRIADNSVLFKFLVKSLGFKHGILPSFMAKPWDDLQGCSGHIHVSLKDSSGRSIFAVSDSVLRSGGRDDAAYPDTRYISKEAEWFLAGILNGVADVMPLFVPTINGYKRVLGGEAYWAPDALTYGYDSRSACIRIISPPSVPNDATRFEVRIPGADMNPYLALSAVFGIGLRGMVKKLALPGPPLGQLSLDDVSKGKLNMLPKSLEKATERMLRPESVAREVLGDGFVDHFGATREHEVALWNKAVTDWEIARYLELA